MKHLIFSKRHLFFLSIVLIQVMTHAWANSVVWSCSRSEPKQTIFEGIRAFHIEKLTVKDEDTISITLMDLYAAYGGEVIQMGKTKLSVCRLPAHDPLQVNALELLGYNSDDLLKASKRSTSSLIETPSMHEMHKCLSENHPAIGFFQNVVENERIAPCF